MPGWVDAHVYGYCIDLYLNTFPLSGGESIMEHAAKGGVAVCLQSDKEANEKYLDEYTSNAGFLDFKDFCNGKGFDTDLREIRSLFGFSSVYDSDEYVEHASRAISDKEFFKRCSLFNKLYMEYFFLDSSRASKSFVDAINV
jgi:hypothetical protein